MLAPDAALCLDARLVGSDRPGAIIHFFKGRQYACWDVDGDTILAGYPRDIDTDWPGLLAAYPTKRLRGALHVPEWHPGILFLFEGEREAVVWDLARRSIATERVDVGRLLPSAVTAGDFTPVAGELADGRRIVYSFSGRDYTRFTVNTAPPPAEDPGFPRRIADDWKDGLVFAPRAGVYVDWRTRSSAHSNRKLYFFMGDLYLRWDVPSHTRNYRLDVVAGWKGWPWLPDGAVQFHP
jgi:hypothetical protein